MAARERIAQQMGAVKFQPIDGPPQVIGQLAPLLLDALLTHPDDLIALLVERGALERTAYWQVETGWVLLPTKRPFPADGTPSYRQVREEGPTP